MENIYDYLRHNRILFDIDRTDLDQRIADIHLEISHNHNIYPSKRHNKKIAKGNGNGIAIAKAQKLTGFLKLTTLPLTLFFCFEAISISAAACVVEGLASIRLLVEEVGQDVGPTISLRQWLLANGLRFTKSLQRNNGLFHSKNRSRILTIVPHQLTELVWDVLVVVVVDVGNTIGIRLRCRNCSYCHDIRCIRMVHTHRSVDRSNSV